MKLRDTPVMRGAALACILVAAAFFIRAWIRSGPAYPETEYQCESCGGAFTTPLSLKPVCPSCKSAGLETVSLFCPGCKSAFPAWEVRVLGPGQRQIRTPGTDEWLDRPPESVTCPTCQRTGAPGSDFSYRRGAVPSSGEILD